jgi:serine/threonine protein phosphatase PrpC
MGLIHRNKHREEDKDKDKGADPADGQGADATPPSSEQPGPGHLAQRYGEADNRQDYSDNPKPPPEGPWRDAEIQQQSAPNPAVGRHAYPAPQGYPNPQAKRGYPDPRTQQGSPDPQAPTAYPGQPSTTDRQDEITRAYRQQYLTRDEAGRSAATGPDIMAPMPTAGVTPDHAASVPGSTEDASSQDAAAPPSGPDPAAPKATDRPQIVLSTQPAVADPVDTELRVCPEPLVIGDMPTLRSDPRGLPKPDLVPGPAVPDSVLDGADYEGLAIRGASLRGDSHRYNAIVRQDSMGIWRVGEREAAAVLVCVTDGVSSEPLSHRGAAEACRLLRDAVALDVPDLFKGPKSRIRSAWADMAGKISDQLTAVAGYLGVAPKALSTTLAAVLIELNPPDPAQRRFVILNVGDATAFFLSNQEFISLLADPHDTTITSTGTYALPTSLGEVAVDVGSIGPGDMLMVCTDGMSNPMRNKNVCDQLAEWWGSGRVPSMPEFGWQMSYRAKTYDDDRTAVCIWGC